MHKTLEPDEATETSTHLSLGTYLQSKSILSPHLLSDPLKTELAGNVISLEGQADSKNAAKIIIWPAFHMLSGRGGKQEIQSRLISISPSTERTYMPPSLLIVASLVLEYCLRLFTRLCVRCRVLIPLFSLIPFQAGLVAVSEMCILYSSYSSNPELTHRGDKIWILGSS